MPEIDHDAVGRVMMSQGAYGTGVVPNPFVGLCREWQRRKTAYLLRTEIAHKIESLYEPRFITPPETSELIEALVTCYDARSILELGMHVGFTSLHILRAIVGKEGARLTSVDCRPALDRAWFGQDSIKPHFEFVEGWTPGVIIEKLAGRDFDFVFIDSDHTVGHCELERQALMTVTKPGSIWLFHDLPYWRSPTDHAKPPVTEWVEGLVADGFLAGLIFPTAPQADCEHCFGVGYPRELNPNLGLFRRLR